MNHEPTIQPPVQGITDETLQRFKTNFRGELLRLGDPGYNKARTLHNAMIDKHPGLIARCRGVADVISAVNFARTYNLPVAVRSGGHSHAGLSSCEGGLVIDLSDMKGVRVDPLKHTVRAQAGIIWREFDSETQAFGLATNGGTVPSVGIAGFTLGGGVGWLMRRYGLTCDNLLGADVVTADGRFLTASATENPDLFWGLRGGGGNFGIVTSFEYRLYPISTVLGGTLVYPAAKARDFLRFYRDFMQTAPDELTANAAMTVLEDGTRTAVLVLCYSGDLTMGEKVLHPLRQFGPPLLDAVQPMPYRGIQALAEEGFPAGLYNYWKTRMLKTLGDEVFDTALAHVPKIPSSLCAFYFVPLTGAVSRARRDESAFPGRSGECAMVIVARWKDPAEAEKTRRWGRGLWEAMEPHATGGIYLNFVAGDENAEELRIAYGTSYDRLVMLKNKYDPTNFFCLNANVRPTL